MTTPVLTQSQTQAASICNVAVGRVSADAGTAVNQTFTCGFVPRYVKWVNLTDRITDEWYEGMAAGSAIETAAAGTMTLETSGGITVNTNAANAVNGGSFTVDSTIIVASKVFAWMAIG